ncbi:MAG: hypothetical protein IJZ35_04985 [Clostridia bacterium]|nr:hypothetical protein [Clostridia bacterium]
MILNRLVITQGDPLRFHLNHTENGEVYQLAEGEEYFLSVTNEENPGQSVLHFHNSDADFEIYLNLDEGSYVFELGVRTEDGDTRVILPALDERHRALNQLLVLRRLYDEC